MLPLIPIAIALGAGAGIGAIVTKIFSDSEKDEFVETELAAMHKKANLFKEHFEELRTKMEDTREYFDFVTGIVAFGVAIARVDDGEIDEYEKKELEEYLCGTTFLALPPHVQENIREIYENKEMNFLTACGFLKRIRKGEKREFIAEMLRFVALSNNDFTPKQQEFIENYQKMQDLIEFQEPEDE